MDLNGKYVLVVGCGVSGIAAAKLLYQIGARPVLFDTNENLKKEEVLSRFDGKCDVTFSFKFLLFCKPNIRNQVS